MNNFSLDVGYIDTPGSTEVIAYDSSGDALDTVPIQDPGIVNVSISVPGTASFAVETVDPSNPDPDGWAIDNVAFEGYAFLTGPPTAGEQGAGPNESEHATTCSGGDPVSCATGDFLQQFTDFTMPGRGIPLTLTRTYSSGSAGTDGPFGFGWTDSYDMSLITDASGDVTISQENGSTVFFQPDGSGGFVAPQRVLATLVQNPDGSYTFTREPSQDEHDFSASGQLTSEVDGNGYTTKLTYTGGLLTAVTDTAGRQLTFTYTGSHIATVTDPMGRIWSYTYDDSGNLTGARDPMGRAWSFTYDSGHLLLTKTDPRGGKTANTYNGSGQVSSQTDPDGSTTTWSYSGDPTSVAGGVTTMTDPNGNVTTYAYSTMELQSVTHGTGTADAATTSYTYDPATLGVTSVTEPNGNVTTSTYDTEGNLLSTTDPLGNTTSYAFNSFDEVLTKTSPLGETTSYTYDGNGNLLTVTDPLGNTTTYAHVDSAHPGDVTSVTNPVGDVTSYTYDGDGDVASVSTSPSTGVTEVTTYAYDADGERTCAASPNATTAHVSCSAAAGPPAADTTATSYNADGETTAITDPDGRTTSYAYDADGNQTQATDPAGHVTSYTYNGNNEQTKITRPGGVSTTSTYDGDGNQTSQTNTAGDATKYAYDALSRVISSTNPLGQTTSYGYDADGNRTTLTDPSGRVTTYTYDQASELTGITYSDGTTPDVSYTYDADGQRSGMTDGTGTTTYAYDADCHLTSVTNGAGATVSYSYNPAGQLTSLTYPNGQAVTRAYDGAGQLTTVSDWLGNTTKFSYDADGNLTSEAYPNGLTAASSFDSADHLVAITDKVNSAMLASFTYTRDSLGQVTSAAQGGTLHGTQNYSYTQLSQLASDNSGPYSYDQAGNLTQVPGGITQTYNAASELTSSTQPAAPKAPASDQVASANETSKGSAITSPAFTTKSANELALAFISANGPASKAQKITSVTGGKLTWTLAARSNARHGTAEVWQAHATRLLKGIKVTAKMQDKGYNGSITIATFTGAGNAIGAHATASKASGAPAVSLTTTGADSLVWAAGEDPGHATARKAAAGQAITHQYLDTKGKSTSWAQHSAEIPNAHTVVKIADTAPTADKWEMAAVEITAAAAGNVKITYGYDKDGNRTAITRAGQPATSLTYDQASRLIAYGTTATYAYNGDGLRMSKTVSGTTTAFAWDQSGALPVLITSGSTYYIYGPNDQPIEQIQGSNVTYLQDDQQGSTRLLTNSDGAIVGTYTYNSYGETVGHTGTATTTLQYDGQYADVESNLIYLHARYYEPASGQFISADPAVSLTADPYGYAAGNPLNAADPTGLSWWNPSTWSPDVRSFVGTAATVVGLGLSAAALVVSLPVVVGIAGVGLAALGAYTACAGGQSGTFDCEISIAGVATALAPFLVVSATGAAVLGAVLGGLATGIQVIYDSAKSLYEETESAPSGTPMGRALNC